MVFLCLRDLDSLHAFMLIEKKQLYCSIRKTQVAATPEEYVRQVILHDLVQRLGFPATFIAVEKELKSMPNLSFYEGPWPERRLDIICYSKQDKKGLHPLLLIECKAISLTAKEIRQVIGYNHILKASFIALANHQERKLGWFDSDLLDYKFINYFPTYSELIKSIS